MKNRTKQYIEEDVNVSEVAETESNETEAKKEVKLPKPVIFRTKSNENIIITPISEKVYRKDYTDPLKPVSMMANSHGNIRRTKEIRLPQNRDKVTLNNVWELVEHLVTHCGYKYM